MLQPETHAWGMPATHAWGLAPLHGAGMVPGWVLLGLLAAVLIALAVAAPRLAARRR